MKICVQISVLIYNILEIKLKIGYGDHTAGFVSVDIDISFSLYHNLNPILCYIAIVNPSRLHKGVD